MTNIILGFVLGMAFAIIVGVITVAVDSRVHSEDVPDIVCFGLALASMLISIATIIVVKR